MYSLCVKVLFLLSLLICQAHLKDVQCIANIFDYLKQQIHEIKSFDSLDDYMDSSCAQCYWSMGNNQDHFKEDSIVNEYMTPIYKSASQPQVLMYFYNSTSKGYFRPFKYSELNFNEKEKDFYLSQFKNDYHRDFFLKCCSDAKYCCENTQSSENRQTQNCPAIWDGWACWHSAQPDTTESVICPDMIYKDYDFVPTECSRENAYRECTSKGTWATHSRNNSGKIVLEEYPHYEPCQKLIGPVQRRMYYTYIAGYFVSLLFTLIGSMIFLIYKQYRLLRIRIHLNFFLSLMLTSIFSIVFYLQMIENPESNTTCKSVSVMFKATHLTNYCWMLIEGIYLHQLIATVAAFREKQHARFYYIFGWVTSPVIMVLYIIVHSMNEYDDYCWNGGGSTAPNIIWYTVPLICLTTNIILLINIIRVMFTKLRSTPDHLKSGIKATIALIPIYGFQYIFYTIPVNPMKTCSPGMFAIKYFGIIFESFQGAIITSIFCFFNREVHINIKRTIRRKLSKKSLAERVTEEQEIGSTTT